MPSCPADLTVASLTTASGSQLDFWIDAANKKAEKKVLVKTGRVDTRRERLAGYYGLDLSAMPVTPTIGPVSRDVAINKSQWAHLRALGAEWAQKDSAKIPFRLVTEVPSVNSTHPLLPSIKSAIEETLAGSAAFSAGSASEPQQTGGMDDETVQALIESAKEGDMASMIALFKLQASITGQPPVAPAIQQTISASSSSIPTNIPLTPNTFFSATSGSSSTPSSLPIESTESTSSDSMILASGSMSIEALTRADGLRDVIAQHESGAVAKIRDLYGPVKGRETNPMWKNIKVTITRRERLVLEFQNEFQGDKEKFFSFFTTTDPGSTGNKRKAPEPVEKIRPLRRVVEAIPHRDKDLKTEQQLEDYQNSGVFSEDLWVTKWAGYNKWEIWRAIGKEKY
ncbi:hypothetical protein FB451DRAFT_1367472 [Mycena latifolia]|nr:hypothetical protein FB451DRAFT_1367472 [Mycena latifolia]